MIEEKKAEQDDYLISTQTAADLLNVKIGTIGVWKCTKKYDLKSVKIGRDNFYKKADIEMIKQSRSKF